MRALPATSWPAAAHLAFSCSNFFVRALRARQGQKRVEIFRRFASLPPRFGYVRIRHVRPKIAQNQTVARVCACTCQEPLLHARITAEGRLACCHAIAALVVALYLFLRIPLHTHSLMNLLQTSQRQRRRQLYKYIDRA